MSDDDDPSPTSGADPDASPADALGRGDGEGRSARRRDRAPAAPRRRLLPILVIAGGVALILATDLPTTNVIVALGAAYLFLRIGFAVIGSFARPVPEPPPPGELRRVRIVYRCSLCGTEVRMTVANDEVPDPPRHCQDEMELVAPIDE